MIGTDQAQAEPAVLPDPGVTAPEGLELRHLRYFVAVADAGTFTHGAERMFIAQPTLSQQIRRLEEMVGAPLLERRREGVRLTDAGRVLLEESRTVLSLVDHGVSRTRQAAGLGQPRLRFVVPPGLPEELAVGAASRLRATATAAGVDVTWVEAPLDAEFSPVRQRRADAGLGWLTGPGDAVPAPLEVMSLGEFAPEVWLPATHPAAAGRVIGLDELAELAVVHGPRRLSSGIYDAWLEAPLDADFSPVRQRRADAGLGWLTEPGGVVPAPLEVMSLGEFAPEVWLPSTHPAAAGRVIGLGELAELAVVHGPRRLSSGTYDAWLDVFRASNPRFEFTDPPFRHSLPMTLAFAATASRPTAVLTGPRHEAGAWCEPVQPAPAAGAYEMVPVHIDHCPLTAAAALVWSGDLPRQLQQVLFDTADSIVF